MKEIEVQKTFPTREIAGSWSEWKIPDFEKLPRHYKVIGNYSSSLPTERDSHQVSLYWRITNTINGKSWKGSDHTWVNKEKTGYIQIKLYKNLLGKYEFAISKSH